MTNHKQNAIEAGARTVTPHLYYMYDEWDEATNEDRKTAIEMSTQVITAALPHIREMIAEEIMAYTPTTEIVRSHFSASADEYGTRDGVDLTMEEAETAFNNWHTEELRKAKADGFDEGIRASGLDLDYILQLLDNNPYRSQP